ncbi:hypothetical protein G7Y89_g13579 [Cudoniella acicularis]|uniref:Uncharacterized protein n=1 Tax=Cudoniella acicularis TaxID=354080 RepID=A0A8H4R9K2_9HELO|nr:hypothetical protein G7Y89_g13579 [Cudoniella acicularis]
MGSVLDPILSCANLGPKNGKGAIGGIIGCDVRCSGNYFYFEEGVGPELLWSRFLYFYQVYCASGCKTTPKIETLLLQLLWVACIIVAFNFVYRIAYINNSGTCIIGLELKVLMPLIIFDAAINLYLTMLFIIPLRGLYSYKNNPDSKIRTIAFRSFIGSCGTLTSSIVNLTVLMVLHGEAAWICLMCCNADILFSVLVLHWVTSKDSSGSSVDPSSGQTPGSRLTKPQSSSAKNKLRSMFAKGSKAENTQKGWEWASGRITTEIHAGDTDHELDTISTDKRGINVKIGHTVVVETGDGKLACSRSVQSEITEEGRSKSECSETEVETAGSTTTREVQRREGSMEDLVCISAPMDQQNRLTHLGEEKVFYIDWLKEADLGTGKLRCYPDDCRITEISIQSMLEEPGRYPSGGDYRMETPTGIPGLRFVPNFRYFRLLFTTDEDIKSPEQKSEDLYGTRITRGLLLPVDIRLGETRPSSSLMFIGKSVFISK